MTIPGQLGYAPLPNGWIVLAHGRTISALDARTAPAVLDRLWATITSPQVTLESYVAAIPLFGPEAVDSFAVAVLDDASAENAADGAAHDDRSGVKITVVVRGEGVVEVRTVGGTRAIDARDAQPWYLAEFDSVVAFALGTNIPADAFDEPRLPLYSAAVHAAFAAWVSDGAAEPGWDGDLEDTVLGTDVGAGAGAGVGVGDSGDVADGRGPTTAQDGAVLGDTILRGERRASYTDAVDGATILRRAPEAPTPGADLAEPPDIADTDIADTDIADTDIADTVIRAGRPTAVPLTPAPPSPTPTPPTDRAIYSFRVGIGEAYPLDTAAYVGRTPSPPRIADGAAPRLVRVGSPTREVSSTHVEIRQQGTIVVVTDLRSTNGTVVSMPGAERVRLRQGESLVVVPGTRIDIGDGNVLEILPAR